MIDLIQALAIIALAISVGELLLRSMRDRRAIAQDLRLREKEAAALSAHLLLLDAEVARLRRLP